MKRYILDAKSSASWELEHGELVKAVNELPKGKSWMVEVKAYRDDRSSKQCRYLNGVAYKLLGEATGYDRDDISEYLCGQYFGWKDKRKPGKQVVQVPVRTTTTDENGERHVLSTTEFSDYVAFVQRFAAEHGIHIPDPDEALAA